MAVYKVGAYQTDSTELVVPVELSLAAENVSFSYDGYTSTDVKNAIVESKTIANNLSRFSIQFLKGGAPASGTFIGPSSDTNGTDNPRIFPVSCILSEYTFSNRNTNADYTLEFYKNGTAVEDKIYTISKTDTQYFYVSGLSLSFSAGDIIYIKYIKDNHSADDIVIVLFLKMV